MPIAAVIFDMDGLMLDTEPIYGHAWQTAAAELGHPLDAGLYSRMFGRNNTDCEGMLLEQFGSGFPLAEFRIRWKALWDERVERCGIARKPGLLELLAYLEAAHIPMAVATSSGRDYVTRSLRYGGLDGRFRHIVTYSDVQRGKPAPDIYLEAARILGVAPADCIAIEDSEAGAVSAAAAGIPVLLIPDLKPPSAAATGAALCVFDSLHQVPEFLSRHLPPAARG